MPGWTRSVERLPTELADRALKALGALARVAPSLADVVLLAGRPR